MIIKSICMTSNIDLENESISENAMKQVVNDFNSKDVSLTLELRKNKVGKVNKLKYIENKGIEAEITVTNEIIEELIGNGKKYYLVPGGVCLDAKNVGGVKQIEKMKVNEISLTEYPVDTTLTPIKIKE